MYSRFRVYNGYNTRIYASLYAYHTRIYAYIYLISTVYRASYIYQSYGNRKIFFKLFINGGARATEQGVTSQMAPQSILHK